MYTGDSMKKTEFITFRADQITKEKLAQIAAEKKWSISFVVEQIVQQWLEEHTKDDL